MTDTYINYNIEEAAMSGISEILKISLLSTD